MDPKIFFALPKESGPMSGHRTPRNRTPKTGGILLAAALAAGIGGCYSEGGLGWSEDQFVYVSRPYQPWMVSLKDTRTGQEVWSVEVPVGKQLVVRFLPKTGTEGSFTPDRMDWGLMDEGTEEGRLGNSLPVPPANSRILVPVLRTVPEFPPGMVREAGPGTGGAKKAEPLPPNR
jgi:hypothetical protein